MKSASKQSSARGGQDEEGNEVKFGEGEEGDQVAVVGDGGGRGK
jgi:hypothetical protein